MHILNYQNFIDSQHVCRIDGDGCMSARAMHRRHSARRRVENNPVKPQAQGQTGIKLKENFDKFSVQLPNGEELITYQDGRLELKSKDGDVRPMLPSNAVRKNLIS